MQRHDFTKEQEELIYELHKKGLSAKNIGLKFDVGPKPIQRILTNIYSVNFQEYAKVGDVVNGWEILEVYTRNTGKQLQSMAKIKSVIPGIEKEDSVPLTRLTNKTIAGPVRKKREDIPHNKRHNETKTRIYTIWAGVLYRCRKNQSEKFNGTTYQNYNVTYCPEWELYENFRDWAFANGYRDDLTIDRIDYTKGYEPSNCRWVGYTVQARNKPCNLNLQITAFGETKDMYEWIEDDRCVVDNSCLAYRIKSGWDHERALTELSERDNNKQKKQPFNKWLKENYPEVYNLYFEDYHLEKHDYHLIKQFIK